MSFDSAIDSIQKQLAAKMAEKAAIEAKAAAEEQARKTSAQQLDNYIANLVSRSIDQGAPRDNAIKALFARSQDPVATYFDLVAQAAFHPVFGLVADRGTLAFKGESYTNFKALKADIETYLHLENKAIPLDSFVAFVNTYAANRDKYSPDSVKALALTEAIKASQPVPYPANLTMEDAFWANAQGLIEIF